MGQVAGYGRLGQFQDLYQVPHAPFAFKKQAEQTQAHLVREALEDPERGGILHGRRLYSDIRI